MNKMRILSVANCALKLLPISVFVLLFFCTSREDKEFLCAHHWEASHILSFENDSTVSVPLRINNYSFIISFFNKNCIDSKPWGTYTDSTKYYPTEKETIKMCQDEDWTYLLDTKNLRIWDYLYCHYSIGCNGGTGRYLFKGKRIGIMLGGHTCVGCPDGATREVEENQKSMWKILENNPKFEATKDSLVFWQHPLTKVVFYPCDYCDEKNIDDNEY